MLLKFFISICATLLITTHLFAATPVEIHGAMIVNGNKIVGAKDNKPVQVAGMSLYWSKWGGERFYNAQSVNWLVQDWKITLIRAAMGVESNGTTQTNKGYLTDPARQINYVKTVIDAAIANGIYVIVDWHDHNANKHADSAKIFFGELANMYKNTPNIIWEIWNEPNDTAGTGTIKNGKSADTWKDVTDYAEQVIPVIRAHSNNLIVVGTPNWCQSVDSAAAKPISGTNISYTLHFYAGTHGKWLRDRADKALNKSIALFITEFGLTDASGGNSDSNLYYDSTKAWLDWADQKGISWANWSVVNKKEKSAALLSSTTALNSWSTNNLSESGNWIRNRLLSRPAESTNILISGDGVKVSKCQTPLFSIHHGYLNLKMVNDYKSAMLLSPSGRVLHKATTQSGSVEMRLGTGLHLLRIEKESGSIGTFQIIGQ